MKYLILISFSLFLPFLCMADILNKSIWESTKKGSIAQLKKALNSGANINITDGRSGNTPLHLMVQANQMSMVKLALKEGAKINARNNQGDTPLLLAAFDDSMIKFLLKEGADPLATNKLGQQITHVTAMFGNTRVLRAFEGYELDFNKTDIAGNTLLHIAAEKGHSFYIRALLQYGVDINKKNLEGNTPLHIAALFNRSRCVEVLLDNQSNVLLVNKEDQFALQLTSEEKIENSIFSEMKSQRLKAVNTMEKHKLKAQETTKTKKVNLDKDLNNHDSKKIEGAIDDIATEIAEEILNQDNDFEEITL